MCFDGPEGSIKSHKVEGPLKHMRFLGPSKHMRFLEGRNTSGSIKTHEVFGSIKTHEVSRGEVSIKTWGFWVHQNTWGFERGKTWLGSIKSLELFGSIKTHEVFCSEKHPLVYNWQPNFRLQVLQNFHLHLNFCLTDLWYNTELASRGKPLLGSTNSVLWLPTLGVRGQSPY